MRLFSSLTKLCLIASSVLAQNASFIAQEISQISQCGLNCLEMTIPPVGCSFTNTTCQCSSALLVETTSACMQANCTIAESLALSKIQAAICQRPYQSQNRKLRIMTIVTAIFTNTAALLRFATRICLRQTMGLDDLFIAGAVIAEILFTYFGVQLEDYGFGNHVWDIEIDTIPLLFVRFYICELLYIITIGLVKVSLLFFYLRVFPKKSFRVACWATMAFCAASGIAFAIVTVFQCHPIIYVWKKDLKGKCVNYNSVAWANAAVNILQDVIIIVLPMNELRHLQLNTRKKIGMYAMFGVGSFVCITSIIRLESLKTFGLTADPTWDNVPTTFWSTLETSTAILCSCMPAIRAGIINFFPTILDPPLHGSLSPDQPSKSPDGGLEPSRVVREKQKISPISLLPPNIRIKAYQNISAAISETTKARIKESEQKYGIGSIKHITAVTEYLRKTEQDKPLPLLPISNANKLPKLSTSVEGEEVRDVGDSAESSSSVTYHSKSFV